MNFNFSLLTVMNRIKISVIARHSLVTFGLIIKKINTINIYLSQITV